MNKSENFQQPAESQKLYDENVSDNDQDIDNSNEPDLEKVSSGYSHSVSNINYANNMLLSGSEIYQDQVNPHGSTKPTVYSKILIGILIFICSCLGVIFMSPTIKDWQSNKIKQNSQTEELLNANTFYKGIIVNEIDLGGMTMEQAKEALKPVELQLRKNISINVKFQNQEINLNQDNFKFTYNTDQVLETAYSIARTGDNFLRRYLIDLLSVYPVKMSIKCELVNDDVTDAVNLVAKKVNAKVKNPDVASFDVRKSQPFTYSDGQNGVELIQDEFEAILRNALQSSSTTSIVAPIKYTKYTGTIDDVKKRTKLIGEYTTSAASSAANSVYNMNKSFNAINGTVLKPGQVFSFNGTTGNTTTAASGYKKSTAISNGKFVQSYGGGICQSATTLYVAALKSGLTIVERRRHSIPSSYVPLGMDATISYPYVDLKFRNDTAYPVYIGCYMNGRTLICKIFGMPKG